MAVLAIKTEPKCKLCKSAVRPQIDALLEKRSRREEDAGGNRINEEYVLTTLAEWGVENPTAENIKNHWKKHCEVVDGSLIEDADRVKAEQADARIKVVDRVLGADWREVTPSPEQILELERALFPFDVEVRILSGQPLGITFDTVHRGIDSSTRRRQEENTGKLIGALGQGIAAALGQKSEQPAIEAPVDSEAVEDAEVVAPIAEERSGDGE